MPGAEFYNLAALEQVAVNLFYGWGYNFYRLENQLRADDLLVRTQLGALLGRARGSVDTAESGYRRAFLPPPSREKPRHDPEALANAQHLETLSRAIGALEGQIRAQPVPENDRMSQRYRSEAATLQQLIVCDTQLTGQAELLRQMLDHKDGVWMVANAADIQDGVSAIERGLQERWSVLGA